MIARKFNFTITEKGYKGGLVSKVKNKHSGKKYIISTAQEIGKDYWTTVVAPSKLFGLWMDFNNRITWIRNSKEEAREIHWKLKEVILNYPESEWEEKSPNPVPPDGYSKDAQEIFEQQLGFIPNENKK